MATNEEIKAELEAIAENAKSSVEAIKAAAESSNAAVRKMGESHLESIKKLTIGLESVTGFIDDIQAAFNAFDSSKFMVDATKKMNSFAMQTGTFLAGFTKATGDAIAQTGKLGSTLNSTAVMAMALGWEKGISRLAPEIKKADELLQSTEKQALQTALAFGSMKNPISNT